MTYQNVLVGLLICLVLGVIWMFATSGEKKIFTGKMVGLALKTVGFTTLIGGLALLYNGPFFWFSTVGLFLVLAAAFSLFAWWYWHKQHLLDLDASALTRWEFPQVFTLVSLMAIVLIGVLWAKQERFTGGADAGAMLTILPACLVLWIPPGIVWTFLRWNEIPIRIKYYEPWMLPVKQDPPVIEPSADALRIFFSIPMLEEGEEVANFDVRIPRRRNLSEIFHHLLYQHNVQERSHQKIVIAHQNKSAYLYGWLLYRQRRKWWRDYRDYLDLESPVGHTDLINGERIYAERVRVWETNNKKA